MLTSGSPKRLQIPQEILNCGLLNLNKPVFLYRSGNDMWLSNTKKMSNCYGRIRIDKNNFFELPSNALRSIPPKISYTFIFYIYKGTVCFNIYLNDKQGFEKCKIQIPDEIRKNCKTNLKDNLYLCLNYSQTYLSNKCKSCDTCYGVFKLDKDYSFTITDNLALVFDHFEHLSFSTFGNCILINCDN